MQSNILQSLLPTMDLFKEIENERAANNAGQRLGSKQSFADKFAAEVSRLEVDIASQEQHVLDLAMLLLDEMDKAAHESNGSVAISSNPFRRQADDLVSFCQKLQPFVLTTKQALQEAASYADETLNTKCVPFLEHETSHAPWKGSNTSLVVALSDVYDAIRSIEKQAGSVLPGGSQKWEAPSSFQRTTTKYWVEEDLLDKLLFACAKEVPLLVYGQSGRLTSQDDPHSLGRDHLWDKLSSPISSVYFDSARMSMYRKRIARYEGAQLFRIRWYGSKPQGNDPIFLELKTHHEKWVNAPSVKERVTILEKHMGGVLESKRWCYDDAKPIVVAGNPKLQGKKLDDAVNLLLNMHNLVVEEDLRPCVRTVYSRVAFQSPSTNELRLTIDRNITVIDETSAPKGAWCSPEYVAVDPSRVKRFPYPVFEVKLAGSEMPHGIASLMDDGTIHEAAKFSKFLTGAACFQAKKVNTLPYWADHPAFQALMLLPNAAKQRLASPTANEKQLSVRSTQVPDFQPSKRFETSQGSVDTVADSTLSGESCSKGCATSRLSRFTKWLSNKKTSIAAKSRARVEPKTYFANERTFIQWISVSLWLVTISSLIIERDQYGTSHLTTTGIALCSGALAVVAWASYVYSRRIRLLRSGNPRGYVDHIAPILLAGSVLIGVIVLLVEKTSIATSMAASGVGPLRPELGRCFLHPNMGISNLQYQPSDVAVDDRRQMLLVPSLDRIMGHSTMNLDFVQELARVPGADFEGLVEANGRVFALSEAQSGNATGLLELSWRGVKLELLKRWDVEGGTGNYGEGLAYMPGPDGQGSLYVETDISIDIFDLPPPFNSSSDWAIYSGSKLAKKDSLNKKLMISGLLDGKIGAMYFFRDILYVLHDNDGVVRSWDVANGVMIAEINLPNVSSPAFQKQWEGIAIEPNVGKFSPIAPGGTFLRGTNEHTHSDLIVHLVMDTPPEIWSFSVNEGDTPGHLIFPACAGVVN